MFTANAIRIRKLGASRKARKRVLGTLVFTLFSAYFFLGAVPVGAADSCTTLYGSSGSITISAACEFTPGTYSYDNVTVEGGVTVTVGDAASPGQVVINVSGDFELCATCAMTADSLGHPRGEGTGQGTDHSYQAGGAGHGGKGGDGYLGIPAGITYGSPTQPVELGSGGGSDGALSEGGGAIKLEVTGTATIDGTITADGNVGGGSDGGGGAGGSIWIDAGTVTGAGTVTANGGSPADLGGPGGGGRIAVHYDVDDSFGWNLEAYGGVTARGDIYWANKNGAAGTIYKKLGSADGDLIVANNDLEYSNWTDQVGGTSETYDNIAIEDGSLYRIPSGVSLTLDSGSLSGGSGDQATLAISDGGTFDPGSATYTFDGLDIQNDGTVPTVTNLTVTNGVFEHDRTTASFSAGLTDLTVEADGVFDIGSVGTFSLTNVTVKTDGTLSHLANDGVTGTDKDHWLDLSVTNLTVESGGSIDVDARGYPRSEGTGQGTDNSYRAGGAGHGGEGGDGESGVAGGITYGSIKQPITLGSGGGSDGADSEGGGAIKITATTLTLDGTISADGNAGGGSDGGGGAGGSVWINVGTLAGTNGTLTADGGPSADIGGGGGGGRIAIYYTTDNTTNLTKQAYGGTATRLIWATGNGGAGTIYEYAGSGNGDLIVDNNDNPSAKNTVQGGTLSQTYDNIAIRKGSYFRIPSSYSLIMAGGGTFDSNTTEPGGMDVDDGALFDPGVSTLTLDKFDFVHAGTVASVTDLTITDCDYYQAETAAFTPGLDELTIGADATYTMAGTAEHSIGTITVDADGTLTHEVNPANSADNTLDLSVDNFTLNGSINVSGLGYGCDTDSPGHGYGPGGG
ncbi:hypothetical protein ACFL26_02505, partial [Patescibacteria group bacterium]